MRSLFTCSEINDGRELELLGSLADLLCLLFDALALGELDHLLVSDGVEEPEGAVHGRGEEEPPVGTEESLTPLGKLLSFLRRG